MVRFEGIPAAAGLAKGKIAVLPDGLRPGARPRGTPHEEHSNFDRAIEISRRQLGGLAEQSDAQAAAILEFQSELLEDPDFLKRTLDAIEGGASAMDAWRETLDRETAEYRSGSDGYLAARADDLMDLGMRVERNMAGRDGLGRPLSFDGATILVADALTPTQFLEIDLRNIAGIATAKGSPTSHVCILARARGIPMIVGCGEKLLKLPGGSQGILDADAGALLSDIGPSELRAFERRLDDLRAMRASSDARKGEPTITAGGEPVGIYANVDHPHLLETIDAASFDGVGLVRTEFLFQGGAFPDEDEQYGSYCSILRWAAGRPVTFRILDAGGDKPVPGLTIEGEPNPFLGVRGIRLFAQRPEVFRTQIRALVRAAAVGDVKLMVPMVSLPWELAEFRREVEGEVFDLQSKGIACRLPNIGMMVEVPAAALVAEEFDADFFSIGTNDLIQYALAAARDEYRLNALVRDGLAAVLKLIEMVVRAGRQANVEVSVCGDMASVPGQVDLLLKAGIRNLSLAPAAVAAVKETVRNWTARSA